MQVPVAAHTFDFFRVYLSSRDNSAPGAGVWTNPTPLFEGVSSLGLPDPTFTLATTFSAGALNSGGPRGIIVEAQTNNSDNGLAFLGDGLPAAPVLITFPGQVAPNSSSDYWDTHQGAWSTAAGLYVLLVNNGQFEMVLSADAGSTWTIQDGASVNHPPAVLIGAAVQKVDNTIYIFQTHTGASSWQIYSFDLLSGTWKPPVAPVSAAIDEFTSTNPIGFPVSNGLYRFSNGDFGVFYDSRTLVKPVYRLFDSASSTWGAEIALGPLSSGMALTVIDPGLTLIHTFYYSFHNERNTQVNYCTVTHAGVVTPVTTIPPPVGGSVDGVNHPSIQNGMIFVPRDDIADHANAVWVATLPVTSFAKELLPVPPGDANFIQANTLASGGTGYHVGDTGTIDGGVYPQAYTISLVNAGAVTDYSLSPPNGGGGYSVGNNVGTTRGLTQPGAGTGFTINIQSVLAKDPSCAYMMYPNGYALGISLACPSSVAQIGVPYSSSFVVTGGTAPFTFAIIAGALPPGLTLNASTGAVTGTPTTPGNYTYTGQVTDTNGLTATATCSINLSQLLTAACPIPNAIALGVAYSGTITVSGGTPPYTFALTGGSLPPGLTLNTSTGVISGIPTQAGAFNYQITITDSLGATVVINCQFAVGNPTPGTNCPPAWELHRVVATLREQRHVPVKGSVK